MNAAIVCLPAPFYVLPETGDVGGLNASLPPDVLGKLCDHEFSLDALENASRKLKELGGALATIDARSILRVLDDRIMPVLVLESATAADPSGTFTYKIGAATIDFVCGPVRFSERDNQSVIVRLIDCFRYEIGRRFEREGSFKEQLLAFGLRIADGHRRRRSVVGQRLSFVDEGEWAAFLRDAIPRLKRAGWRIEVKPSFPYRVPEALRFRVHLAEDEERGSLTMRLSVFIDGEEFDITRILRAALEWTITDEFGAVIPRRDDDYVEVVSTSGHMHAIHYNSLLPYLRGFALIAQPRLPADEELLRIRARDVSFVEKLLSDGAEEVLFSGVETRRRIQIRQADETLKETSVALGGLPMPLHQHQVEGVLWLKLRAQAGSGGVISDDMGLGKTLQALAFLHIEKVTGSLDRPALIIAPRSLLENWRHEAKKFTPGLRMKIAVGNDGSLAIKDADVVLTTYASITLDPGLRQIDWHTVILDEAGGIKNSNGEAAKAVQLLHSRSRFSLTATPIENSLGDFWSVFEFAVPGLLGSESASRGYLDTQSRVTPIPRPRGC